MISAVIDPSVLVSAFVGSARSGPARVVDAWHDDRFALIVSPALLAELTDVLGRAKFERKGADGRAAAYVEDFAVNGLHHDDPAELASEVRDPKDDYLVALARTAGVDALVSIDRDLLEAGIADINVCRPAAFLALLADQEKPVTPPDDQ